MSSVGGKKLAFLFFYKSGWVGIGLAGGAVGAPASGGEGILPERGGLVGAPAARGGWSLSPHTPERKRLRFAVGIS